MNMEKGMQIPSVSELLVKVVMQSLEVSLVDCNNPSDTMERMMSCKVADMMDSASDHQLICLRMSEPGLLAHKVLFVANLMFLGRSASVNWNLLVQPLFVVGWQLALALAAVACKMSLPVAELVPAILVVGLVCVLVMPLLVVRVIRMVVVILMDLIAAAVVVVVVVVVVVAVLVVVVVVVVVLVPS